MIMDVSKAKQLVAGYATLDDDTIGDQLVAIESVIRKYTNNNFQNRKIRFAAASTSEHVLNGVSPFFRVGDTVQISESAVNDGLYSITALGSASITVDGSLFAVDRNLVTKVEYPPDVVDCAVNLAKWKTEKADKVGIKSETLSRHSVTYEDSTTFFMGYPKALLSALDGYKKARF